MVKSNLSILLLGMLLLSMIFSAPVLAGDPLDANDSPAYVADAGDIEVGVTGVAEFLCDDFLQWPLCKPCLNQCLFAIAVDIATGEWDWN